jgi:hypothetical protein
VIYRKSFLKVQGHPECKALTGYGKNSYETLMMISIPPKYAVSFSVFDSSYADPFLVVRALSKNFPLMKRGRIHQAEECDSLGLGVLGAKEELCRAKFLGEGGTFSRPYGGTRS